MQNLNPYSKMGMGNTKCFGDIFNVFFNIIKPEQQWLNEENIVQTQTEEKTSKIVKAKLSQNLRYNNLVPVLEKNIRYSCYKVLTPTDSLDLMKKILMESYNVKNEKQLYEKGLILFGGIKSDFSKENVLTLEDFAKKDVMQNILNVYTEANEAFKLEIQKLIDNFDDNFSKYEKHVGLDRLFLWTEIFEFINEGLELQRQNKTFYAPFDMMFLIEKFYYIINIMPLIFKIYYQCQHSKEDISELHNILKEQYFETRANISCTYCSISNEIPNEQKDVVEKIYFSLLGLNLLGQD